MESKLAERACVPCRKDSQPLTDEEVQELLEGLPDWDLVREDGVEKLRRVYSFRNFRAALALTVRIGELAEEANHHPALLTEWGKLTVTWWTHSIQGLFINDFILAARSDEAYLALRQG